MDGAVIKTHRKHKGLTQKELADCIGCNPQTIWRWENNKTEISPVYYKKLKEILDIDMEELL